MANKNSLAIRLTESVVFLRSQDVTGRRANSDAQPSIIRGLLVLHVAKPMRISSIELQLQGRTTTSWPEGVGARRIEITEEHKIFSASTVFFRAEAGRASRRPMSVGPGLSVYPDEEDAVDISDDDRSSITPRRNNFNASLNADSNSRYPRSRRVSADYASFQRAPLSYHEELPPTPPYTPASATPNLPEHPPLTPSTSFGRGVRQGENPAQDLEAFRNALRASSHSSGNTPAHTPLAGSSASSIRSFRDTSLSRRPSIEEVPEEPSGPIHPHHESPSPRRTGSMTPTSQDQARETSPRGRGRARFSLAAVSSVLLDAVKERVRSSSPRSRSGYSRDRTMSVERQRSDERDKARGRTAEKGKAREVSRGEEREKEREGKEKKRSSMLGELGDKLRLDTDEKKEVGDGWKEFKKGTYTYPISISVPANSPPTLECDYGHVTWRLKGYVHRPGTFTSKLTATREVVLISSPDEDTTEDTENIIVERQWDGQLQYLISISGRSFFIGGTIPIYLTIMPLTKAKVHRISVILEEKVEYYTQMKRVARSEPVRRIGLLVLKLDKKEGGPILPLASDDPNAFRNSPFYAYLNGQDPSEFASSLMGPGPWTFQHELQVPASCGLVHFTNKNKKSNIGVNHTLKVVFRVERGDDEFVDPKTGKRKLFDIVVQTPVHILSCRCNPEWTSLPEYNTRSPEDAANLTSTCPCEIKRRARAAASDVVEKPEPPSARARYSLPGLERMASRRSTDSNTSMVGDAPLTATMSSLRTLGSLLDRSAQYERLVSGQEGVMGEVPPSYDSVAVQ